MMVNQPLSSRMPKPALPVTSLTTGSSFSHSSSNEAADGVQLSRLGGVLNAFQTNAERANQRIENLTLLVGTNAYPIDAVELSRKMISDMLHKQS